MKEYWKMLKRGLAMALAVVMLLTSSNLGVVLRAAATGTDEPVPGTVSVNLGKLMVEYYDELTDAEKVIIGSGQLDGDKPFQYVVPTDGGALMVFNNDKRGESFFVGETEESVDKSEIHRAYYNRMGHRYVAGFSTLNDDCALKGISKNTVTGSLVLKIASSIGLSFEVKVRSDREGWQSVERFSGGDHSFYGTDFSSFSFDIGKTALLICHERLRRWCEKQYYIYSDGYNTPFGVYSISYRWRVSGRLRERDV